MVLQKVLQVAAIGLVQAGVQRDGDAMRVDAQANGLVACGRRFGLGGEECRLVASVSGGESSAPVCAACMAITAAPAALASHALMLRLGGGPRLPCGTLKCLAHLASVGASMRIAPRLRMIPPPPKLHKGLILRCEWQGMSGFGMK